MDPLVACWVVETHIHLFLTVIRPTTAILPLKRRTPSINRAVEILQKDSPTLSEIGLLLIKTHALGIPHISDNSACEIDVGIVNESIFTTLHSPFRDRHKTSTIWRLVILHL